MFLPKYRRLVESRDGEYEDVAYELEVYDERGVSRGEARFVDYEEGDSNYETQQNKVEFYEQAEEEGRWEWYVNRKLSNTHRRLEMFTDWYLDGVDKYVWSHVPLVN